MGVSQSNTSKEIGLSSTWVKFEDDWFAQGASRLVYRGTFQGNREKEGQPCVVKVYKEQWYEDIGEYAYDVDDRAYQKAHDMAQLFNMHHAVMYPTNPTQKIVEFVKPEFTRVSTRASLRVLHLPIYRTVKGKSANAKDSVKNVIPSNATILVERYLEGDYVKFTSNSGYVHPDGGAVPAAFSHFTYHVSEGQVLISDLQGVLSGTRYTFTDPAILSGGTQLGAYGSTDLGKLGIIKFFKTHVCNDLCRGLNIPRITKVTPAERVAVGKIVESMSVEGSSTCTYQLSKSSGVSKYVLRTLQYDSELETIPEDCAALEDCK